MAGCGEGSFFVGLDFRTGSTLEQAGLYVFNVCRISCLDILMTNYDSGLRGKRTGVRFLCNQNTLYACVYAYVYVTAVLTNAYFYAYACAYVGVASEDRALKTALR